MPRTVTNLKLAVCGFLQREPSSFQRTVGVDTWDVLLQACNNARLYAERMIDFEQSRESAFLEIANVVDGADLSDAVTWATRDNPTPTAVSIKKIHQVYLSLTDGAFAPIDHYSKKSWSMRLKNKLGNRLAEPSTLRDNEISELYRMPVMLVQSGNTVFLSPASTSDYPNGANVAMDIFKWLPEYSTGSENDFLLDYAFDWLMYRAIHELNSYLKEDERVSISKDLMVDAWNAVVKWNQELVASVVEDVDLS